MRIIFSALIVGIACAAAPALAQDEASYQSIKTGDYAKAERALLAQYRAYPRAPEVLLNLAAIYVKSARADQARALYEQVISAPNVLMDLPNDKTALSHDLARLALSRMAPTQLSAR